MTSRCGSLLPSGFRLTCALLMTSPHSEGPFIRVVDPTVDMAAVGHYNHNRTTQEMLVEVVLDGPTDKKRDHLLHGLGANFSRKVNAV